MKKLLGFVGVLLVALVIVVLVVGSQAGGIIKTAVEEIGPEVTGSQVTLSEANVSLLGGTAGLKHFVLGNPKGFKSDNLIQVNKVDVALDVNSLFSEVVHIKHIVIDSAELTYELSGKGSNVAALQKQIEQSTGAGATASTDNGQAGAESAPAKKVIIDKILITGTKINLAASLLQGEGASVIVPDIELKDLGKDQGGATPADVAKKVFKVLNGYVGKSIGNVLSKEQIQAAMNKELGKKVKGVKDKLSSQLGDKLGGELGGKLDKGLGDLFGGSKD